MNMNILVIIVTYNAMQWAERCFNSLRTSNTKHDVIVVDNGSTDGTREFIQKNYPYVIFHQCEQNLGFGKANNVGLLFALDHNYDYVYLLNQDAWVYPDTFERLVSISKRYPTFGILSPIQMEANMQKIDRNFCVGVCNWESNKDILSDFYTQKLKDVYPVKTVMAAHWLVSIECIKKVGLFSPSFPHYGEDDNFANRASYWNYEIGIVPSARAIHDREYRIISRQQQWYMAYIGVINRWSSIINTGLGLPFKRVILYLLKESITKYSLSPLNYILKLVVNRRTIILNRKKTLCESAFI